MKIVTIATGSRSLAQGTLIATAADGRLTVRIGRGTATGWPVGHPSAPRA